MTKLKNYISFLICLIVFIAIFLNSDKIADYIKKSLRFKQELVILPSNAYTKDDKFVTVKQVDDYTPYNFDDLVNIYYSVLNQGWNEFTFYCPIEYDECLDDITKLSYNEVLLSDINNYVHPYNSYSSIKTLYDDMGEVTIKVNHLYSDLEIEQIDKQLDEIMAKTINDNMSEEQKIRALHDYIINLVKYDTVRGSNGTSQYDSARILGLLIDNYAICSGYTDMMAVFLNKMDIPNFKVSSENHVWNAVYYNGQWLHLDLTWDDPVSVTGEDILEHNYFLINNERLDKLSESNKEHNFDKNIYKELNY